MNSVYSECPTFENEKYLLRVVDNEDWKDLIKVYSDEAAVPFFNSDNCYGDDFHYQSEERMKEAIAFWKSQYASGGFVRWSIVDKKSNEAIGTIELFHRDEADYYTDCGLLRLDLRSDYEKVQEIKSIMNLILQPTYELFACSMVATKCISCAEERAQALLMLGFDSSREHLIGHDGTEYDSYYVRKKDSLANGENVQGQYCVERIDEPDFGCEGRMDGEIAYATLLLKAEDGTIQSIQVEDAFLYNRKIKEGSKVILHSEYGVLKVVSVVAAVICDQMPEPMKDIYPTKIFATARGYGEFKGGWEFPGGKVESGETPEDAIRREIMEELETKIEVGSCFHTIEYDYPKFHLSMDCYYACVLDGRLELKEAQESRWLTKETIHSVAWLPADLTLIKILENVLQ